MRYKIWITLIVCGTIIVLAPPLSDYLTDHRISEILLERKDFNSVNFGFAADVAAVSVRVLGAGGRR